MRILLACLFSLVAAPLAAQKYSMPPRPPFLIYGVHYAVPERASFAVAIVNPETNDPDSFRGALIQASVGLSGARLAIGKIDFNSDGARGVQLRATGIRTWKNSWRVAPGQTFVGPELRLTLDYVTAGAGYYWRVKSDGPDRSFFGFSGGIGF